MKALMNDFPFQVPDDKDDQIIANLFEQAARAKDKWKDYEAKADIAKADYDAIAEQLIEAIKETGGTKWEKSKGNWAKINDKHEFSFVKANTSEVLEWVSDNGADDVITVPWQSLQGFVNNRYRYEDEEDEELLGRLPEFIKASKRTKLQIRYTK